MAPFAQASQHGESVYFRQTEIEKNHVWPAERDIGEPLLAGIRFEDPIAVRFEHDAQQPPDLHLIVDDERCGFIAHANSFMTSARIVSTGISSVNSAPPAARFAARALPPWARTKPSTIESPSPVPPGRASAAR